MPVLKNSNTFLNKQAKERILILDGAMGTMIQSYKLEELDYRGDKFSSWPTDLKGNNDLLSITQPKIIEQIHDAFLRLAQILLKRILLMRRVSPWRIMHARLCIRYQLTCRTNCKKFCKSFYRVRS